MAGFFWIATIVIATFAPPKAAAVPIPLEKQYSFAIYTTVAELPKNWDEVAAANIFLGTTYLKVLEDSAPKNMDCHFIGVFQNDELCGVAVSQFLCLRNIESFGERDSRFKTKVRHFFFKIFGTNVLILGNNMLTGQNAFTFTSDIPQSEGIKELYHAVEALRHSLRRNGKRTHLTIYKDFYPNAAVNFELSEFKNFFKFSTQPNMVLKFRDHWKTFDDYVAQLSKKYRDHYKRARKKSAYILKRKMAVAEIEANNAKIHQLYRTVASNAPFNTFYLEPDHFVTMKKLLKDNFLFYGYFDGDELIGFNTLIKNGNDIDTYFLGYDENRQRGAMLYLNMLYDMIGYSVNKGFRQIILARTALEIKSSVGAQPESMIGYMRHSNAFFNFLLPRLFHYFEPEMKWQQRNPFKE